MRVNIYAEEMTDRLEIVSKEIDGHTFTGLRLYLELPATTGYAADGAPHNVSGPFMHRAGDDDSAAVTFWGKRSLRTVLRKALTMLDAHYGDAETPHAEPSKLAAVEEYARANPRASMEQLLGIFFSGGASSKHTGPDAHRMP